MTRFREVYGRIHPPSGGRRAALSTPYILKSAAPMGVPGSPWALDVVQSRAPAASDLRLGNAWRTAGWNTIWKAPSGHDMEKDLLAFFPGEIVINAGDSIWFAEDEPDFHTVYFPAGGQIPPLFIPDPEVASPQAGAPPQLVVNPDVLLPTSSLTVDGTTPVNSGLDILWDPAVPTILTFPTAGAYDYLCIPHQAVMKAAVVVQEAGSALPMDQAGYDALAQEQMAALVEDGKAALAEFANATSEGSRRTTGDCPAAR